MPESTATPAPSTSSVPALMVLGAGTTLTAVLLAAPPSVSGGTTAWTGEELATACLWTLSIACGAWLTLTTLVCVAAAARGHVGLARRAAALAPPLARRALETAALGALTLTPVPAFAASAAPGTTPAGISRHVTTVDGRNGLEIPVVRAPAPETARAPARHPAPADRVREPVPQTRHHVVRAGDNLWRIASSEVARRTGNARPADRDVAPYWRRLVELNRASLRSHDPSLIFPGEVVTLPAVGAPESRPAG